LSCGGGTPTSDNFQKSEEKNWENLDFFEAMQWATLKFLSEVHLWLSFGYLSELAVKRFYPILMNEPTGRKVDKKKKGQPLIQ